MFFFSGGCTQLGRRHSIQSSWAILSSTYRIAYPFSALTLLVGRQEGNPACVGFLVVMI